MHVVFNALEASLKCLPWWESFEKQLKAVNKFLANRELRDRFVGKCLQHAPKALKAKFKNSSQSIIDRRWESVEGVVGPLTAVYDDLVSNFDLTTVQASDMHNQVVQETAKAFQDSEFALRLEIVRVHATAVGKVAGWLEGCPCHPVLSRPELRKRRRAMRHSKLASEGSTTPCPWRGRRCVELAQGHLDAILEEVKHASSTRLQVLVTRANATSRTNTVICLHAAQIAWVEEIDSKLRLHNRLPHLMAGAFHGPGSKSLFVAKEVARQHIYEVACCCCLLAAAAAAAAASLLLLLFLLLPPTAAA